MARKLPELGEKLVAEIEAAWAQPQEAWARRRLLVVRLTAQHELTVAQIMQVAEVSRQTVFTYRDTLVAGGVAALLARRWVPGRVPTVRGAVAKEFVERLEAGNFTRPRMRRLGSRNARANCSRSVPCASCCTAWAAS